MMMKKILAILLLMIPLAMMAQEEGSDMMQVRGNIKFVNESNEKVKAPGKLLYSALNRNAAHEAANKFKEAFKIADEGQKALRVDALIDEYGIRGKSANGSFRRNLLPDMSIIFVDDEDEDVLVLDIVKGQTQYKDIVMKVKRIKEIESIGKARDVAIAVASSDDADDGNARFNVKIYIPAGTARTDSRLIIQTFAVDCQTEDTLDHCDALVYEGEQYHQMQERRMAFNYMKNDRLAKFYRTNAILDESEPFRLDTTIIWPKPSTMKDKVFRGPFVVAFEDYHHPYYFDEQEGTCLIRRPFKFLDFKAALEDIELTEEFFVQADEQIQDKNTRLDLRFEMGTSTLIADSANAAEQSRLLRELGSYGNNLLQLTIMGAASPDGSMKRNQELAQQRANVARQMLKGGLAVTPSISVKVYTWADVVTQLKEQARTEQADQVQAIIDGGGDDMGLTSKMKALPFYSLDIEPILTRMRAMSARYKYRQQRVLTPEECVEEFHKYKKAYWEGTKHFSAGDFYHLYEILEDSLELDTLTQIAYREISSEMDYEIENAMAPYVCNRMAMIQIKRGYANVETLRPFIDLKRYGNGTVGISGNGKEVKRWTATRGNVTWNRKEIIANQAAAYYMEQKQDTALFLIGWLKGNQLEDDNTRMLEALINLKKLHFKARSGKEEADYQSAKRNVLAMSDENKAILYTEIDEWDKRKEAPQWISKMSDNDPRKWYLKGILAAADVDHEPPLIVSGGGDDDSTEENDTVFYKWSEEKVMDYQWSEDPKKVDAYNAYMKRYVQYQKDHDGQDPPMAPAKQEKAKAKPETPVNVDMFKGIPQYLAYFQHCFDLDPTRKYFRHYGEDKQVPEQLRKKFKYKLKNRELYRQMFKLLKQRDDAELPDTAVGNEDGEEGEDGANKAESNGEKKTEDAQKPAEEKKEDQKA